MSILVNGQSCVPPGFRFHPTEEELLNYYLRKKVASQEIDLNVIRDVNLNKLEPWDIQEKCQIGSTLQNDWYFFSQKDKKYPKGPRTNRATVAGFWKATGRDKAIYKAVKRIGMRKTLVFYKGRAPRGQKSDWIMYEYRLDDPSATAAVEVTASTAASSDSWVVCRIFKKKHHHKASPGSGGSADHHGHGSTKYSSDDGALDQIQQYTDLRPMENVLGGHAFMKLPPLENPSSVATVPGGDGGNGIVMDWALMDRLVASHLNSQLCSFDNGGDDDGSAVDRLAFYSAASDDDLWSFARSAANHVTL